MTTQSAILSGVSRAGRYLSFSVRGDTPAEISRDVVTALAVDDDLVVGLGEPLLALWGCELEALRTFPALSGPGVQVPSTQQALWCWLRGDNLGELVIRTHALIESLENAFDLEQLVDGFKYGEADLGLDLTGYEDGTENPTGEDALAAAFVDESKGHLAGSSFVATQLWVHDLERFAEHSTEEQDQIIGRRISDNSEIADAPESAHVKRTEQESFEPPAFILRRSMPFAGSDGEGLQFVAFGSSLDAFEVQLRRMCGLEDGTTDALFKFSAPVSGGYYWCPPVHEGQLDLRAVS